MHGDEEKKAGVPAGADQNDKIGFSLAAEVIKENTKTIWQDVKAIGIASFEDKKKTLRWGAIFAGLILTDKITTQYYQQQIIPNYDIDLPPGPRTPFGTGSNGYIFTGLSAAYVGSVLASSRKGQETALLAGKAVGYSVLFAHIIGKTLTGRNRPYDDLTTCSGGDPSYTCDPFDFFNFQSPIIGSRQAGSAFPSFHVTMYFSIARVYSKAYDSYWIPYGFAAVAFLAEAEGHKHWVSDMVAGAALGTLIGTKVFNNYYKNKEKGSGRREKGALIVPLVSNNSIGVGWMKTL